MKLLILEDEKRLGEALKKGFSMEGFVVDLVGDYDEALNYCEADNYDCLIFDRMLPGGKDGLELCKELRAMNIATPIIMLTAMDAISQRVDGINSGADDYLIKPFAFSELLARVHALLRRPAQVLSTSIDFGKVKIMLLEKKAMKGSVDLELSKTEFEVLSYLIHHPNQTISKENLINQVWGIDADILPNTVEVVMRNIRSKLGDAGKALITVRGYGYMAKLESYNA